MRGDPSDNIFSAYPGVRTKGTKNKIKNNRVKWRMMKYRRKNELNN